MDEILFSLREHLKTHPAATLRDAAKLLYQSVLGCGHLIADPDAARERLDRELDACPETNAPLTEPIGGGYVRLNLRPAEGMLSWETIFRLFYLSSRQTGGGIDDLRSRLGLLLKLGFPQGEAEDFIASYTAAGCPMLSHSEEYRAAYAPAYRVICERYVRFLPVFSTLDRLSRFEGPIVVGIDGMCASGKSTLGRMLADIYDANLFHADDYFLPPELRTADRLSAPGGNMHRERLCREVLEPLARGGEAVTRRFDCGSMELLPPVAHGRRRVNVVEGSYSLHPELREFYTLKIALRTRPDEQLERLRRRSPERLDDFTSRWIPMENRYFEYFDIFGSADIVIDTFSAR